MNGAAVIGVDPGRVKVGYALLDRDGRMLEAGICEIAALAERLAPMVARYEPHAIALGRGTNAAPVAASLASLQLPIRWVDEYETTRRARELYFAEHPPSGWRRLIPRGLLTPARPVDDYAAVLIGRRYLSTLNAPRARGDA